MNIPSVSVDTHFRYTPELRDGILRKLRTSMEQTAYSMLTPAHLRSLASIQSQGAPILSFYLELSPERRARRAWHTMFSSLVDATLKRIDDRHQRRAIKDVFDRIDSALQAELPVLGRGVVFFVCDAIGLWRQIAVSVPLRDAAYLSAHPYVRPLVRTRDEHDRFVLVLLSQEHSRFFISQIGQVAEVFQVKGERVNRMLAERLAPTGGGTRLPEPITHEAHLLAGVVNLLQTQFEGRYLLMSGPGELRKALLQNLPKEVQQRVGGEFTVDVHAGPSEVSAAAEPAQRAVEEREEVKTIRRLLDASPQVAVWGVAPTLDVLRSRRGVMTLAVDDFVEPGARCSDCGALWVGLPSTCAACGSNDIDVVEDVVEMTLEQALDQGAALELVRSAAARQLMSERGPMAAMLR